MENNFFTQENVRWITALLDEASTRTSNEEKATKLKALEAKVRGVLSPSSFIRTTDKDLESLGATMKALEDLRNEYSAIHDLEAIVLYERIKKEMAGHLEYLATLKETLWVDSLMYEDYFKKELRSSLINKIFEETDGKKLSMAAAEKKVELLEEYQHHKQQFFSLQRLALEVRTKYSFYIDLWKMVMQSCSYASRRNQQ